MALAKKGDKVKIEFTGTLEDGTVFDTTQEDEDCSSDDCCSDDDCCEEEGCGCDETGPMELTIGGGEFFEKIEEALVGMAPGETKKVVIPAADGFGEYDEEKVFTVERAQFPDDITPEVGQELVLTNDENEEFGVTVVEVSAESVTIDANHPLAGEDLTYEFHLVEIL